MLDGSGPGGDEILPGAVLSEHPLIVNGFAKLINDDVQPTLSLSSQAISAAIVYDHHPVAVAAPAAHHIETINPVQLMQAQLAAAYGTHNAPIALHGDWSLIAADTHHTVQTDVRDLGHVYADPLAGVDYAHTGFHPYFDHVDPFGFDDPFHFDFGRGLFTHHNLTVDNYF